MPSTTDRLYLGFAITGAGFKNLTEGSFPRLRGNDLFMLAIMDKPLNIKSIHHLKVGSVEEFTGMVSLKKAVHLVRYMKERELVSGTDIFEEYGRSVIEMIPYFKGSLPTAVRNLEKFIVEQVGDSAAKREAFEKTSMFELFRSVEGGEEVLVRELKDDGLSPAESKILQPILEDDDEEDGQISETESKSRQKREKLEGIPEDVVLTTKKSKTITGKGKLKSSEEDLEESADPEEEAKNKGLSFKDLDEGKAITLLRDIDAAIQYEGFNAELIAKTFCKGLSEDTNRATVELAMTLLTYCVVGSNAGKLNFKRSHEKKAKEVMNLIAKLSVEKTATGKDSLTLSRIAVAMVGELYVVRKYMSNAPPPTESKIDKIYQDLAFSGVPEIYNISGYADYAKTYSMKIFKKSKTDKEIGVTADEKERYALFEKSFDKWTQISRKGYASASSQKTKKRMDEALKLDFKGTKDEMVQQAYKWLSESIDYYLDDSALV